MENKTEIPSIAQSLVFKGKASFFQLRRGAQNLLNADLEKFTTQNLLQDKPIAAESKTELWTETAAAERHLTAGKIHNLRLAVKKLNGLEIPAGRIFSFWKQIGKATRFNNYVAGRELREGCLIPNVGGGLCQLSNALYEAALQANFEIVERHAHTQIVRGSLAEKGRDATVFWNYVDLRFKSETAFRIDIKLDASHLTVRFRSDLPPVGKFHKIIRATISPIKKESPNSCGTCGVESCFRAVQPNENADFGRTAFLLDEFSPEFDAYIQKVKNPPDLLRVPLDGKRFKKSNYAWTYGNFEDARQSFFVTAERSLKSRKLAAQGAARQKNLLQMSENLAKSYAKNLPFDALHIVVQQNLLPFLWREGILGGRTFDVLMTNLPIKNLQETLDFASSLHPESRTLGDFRADSQLLKDETEALKNARRIVTPHTEIAALFPNRAELLDWQMPQIKSLNRTVNVKPIIVLPASTVGRKGVYELREAMRGLNVKLITFGANVEDDCFWEGFEVERGNHDHGWLEYADLVVLPAFVEHKPRRVLEAAAHRIPVIASKACGLGNVAGIEIVETGDHAELKSKLQNILTRL